MPGRDRTGPTGQGPLSGRGLGDCGDNEMSDYAGQVPGRGVRMGWGFGWGGGRGYGWGGGRRRGFRFYPSMTRESRPYDWPQVPPYDAETEAKLLRNQASRLHDALDRIEKRLEDLEKE